VITLQLLFKKLIRHWKKILVPLVLVCFFLAVLWILWGFLPAAENDDGTFLVWQKTGTVLAAAGREGLLAYIVRVDDEGGEAGGQEGTHSRLALFLQELATHRGMCTCALAGAHPPAEILSKDLLEPGKPMEAAGIGMSLTPDGSGLWLSLFTNEGKSQAVFFDLEKKEGQTFSLPGRTVTGNITISSLVAQRLFYPAAGKDGKIFATTDRNTLDLPIEVFAMNTDTTAVTAGFRPWLQVLPGDEEFLFLAPEESGAVQIYKHNLVENSRELLLSLEGITAPPALSARGDLLAAATTNTEKPQLLLYALPSGERIELPLDRQPATLLFWDATGEGVYFLATENGKTSLYYASLKKYLPSLAGTQERPGEEGSQNKDQQEEMAQDEAGQLFDLVIRNGTVIDPETETVKFNYNVGIKGERVAVITREEIHGAEEIDATGLLVTPGFIDILSYSPNDVGNRFKAADGVTTNLAMHGATIDFPGWFRYYAKRPMILNYGGAVLQVGFRHKLGIGNYDAPTPAQIEKMKKMTEQAILDGAIGIAFSPEYYPGMTPEEIRGIMEVGKKYDLTSFFHARYATMYGPGGNNFDAINEVIGYAKELKASVQIAHINSTGGTFSMPESLRIIEEARREGVDITVDLYPYNSWATYSNSARFDPGWQERFQISYEDLQVGNSTERLTEESFNRYRKKRVLLIAYAIPDEDVELALQADFAMIGSDTIIEPHMNNHPRGAGCFARTIGLYAREKRVISLMKALKMMTILPARRLDNVAPALQRKGRLRVGMDADITVFDYGEIIDTATAEKTGSYSQGIHYVIVNGVVVKDPHGFRSGVSPGKPIRSYFTPR
jgi:N-acyl-D-aspartate/D-glutamate deacylase